LCFQEACPYTSPMKVFNRLRIISREIPKRTIIPLFIGFVALAIIVSMTFLLNQRAQQNFNNVTAESSLRTAATDLRNNMQGAESSQRGYLYTGNEIYLAPYSVAKGQLEKQLQKVQSGLSRYPELVAAGDRLGTVIEQKIKEMDDTIDLKNKGDDAAALNLVRSNRGKALMDEANVFVSGIIRVTEQKQLEGVREQQRGALILSWVSIIGALVILGTGAIAGYFVLNHTRNLAEAREALNTLNQSLEQRVDERTTELAHTNDDLRVARDRAETLLSDVNHRVANSLAMVSTLVKLQANSIADNTAKDALEQTQSRIHAVSLVHRNLYTSGDARVVSLDEYLAGIVQHLQTATHDQIRDISLVYDFARIRLVADKATSLGVILNEWIINAIKYAYPSGSGVVHIKLLLTEDGLGELTVADEGAGFDPMMRERGTGFGTRIVRAMATSLSGTVEYLATDPGSVSKLVFAVK
jgi:two-component sensor histidine kinase